MKKFMLTIFGGMLALSLIAPANAQRGGGGGNRGGGGQGGGNQGGGNQGGGNQGGGNQGGGNQGGGNQGGGNQGGGNQGGGNQGARVQQGGGGDRAVGANHIASPNRGPGANHIASPNRGPGANHIASPNRGPGANHIAPPNRGPGANHIASPNYGPGANHIASPNYGPGANHIASPNYGPRHLNNNYNNYNNNQWQRNNFNYGGYGQGFGGYGRYGQGYGRYGGFGQGYGRYGQSPIASLIFGRFPSASRLLLSPRGYGNGGAYFRNNGGYYYYPQTVISTFAYPQTQIVNGATSAPVDSQQAPEPTPVVFGGFAHVEELTGMLPVVANDLCLDMHYNYQGNAGFDAAYRDAYALSQSTKTLRAAQLAGNKEAIQAEVRHIDVMLHRIEEQTLSWSRHEQRQVGELGLLTKLEVTADMTHHLMYDVGIEPDPDQHNPGPANERPAQ